MYIPDRDICRKLRNYDPHLFVTWNGRREYFELWRRQEVGRVLITPITERAYDPSKPNTFTPLDERILWWVYDADSWRLDKVTDFSRIWDSRWKEFDERRAKQRSRDYRDMAKDAYTTMTGHFVTKHAPKNTGKPNFNKTSQHGSWERPDIRSRTSQRVFYRSANSARRVNYSR